MTGEYSECQKVLVFPSRTLEGGLPAWKLSAVAVQEAGVMAADMTASAERPSGMASRAIPSRVVIPSVFRCPFCWAWTAGFFAPCTPAAMAAGEIASANGAEAESRANRPSMLDCMLSLRIKE